MAHLAVSSASSDVELPTSITTRPGQTQLEFRAYAKTYAKQQNAEITVQFGQTAVETAVAVVPEDAPILTLPANVDAIFGQQAQFSVTAVDPGGLPVVLSAGNLPTGASFDPGTGQFSWTPAESQQGSYQVTFTATNSLTAASSGQVTIQVGSGTPVITDVVNAASQALQPACGQNAIASLKGHWLAAAGNPVTDPTGGSTQLAGAKVKINGAYVPILYAAEQRIDFLCPTSVPGTALIISVENQLGTADPVQTVMNPFAAALYSLDGSGSGQGQVTLSGTSLIAMSRNYLTPGQPAGPGDAITISATGLDPSNWSSLLLEIGALSAQITAVDAVPGTAGVYQITTSVPIGIEAGDSIPVTLVIPPLRRGPVRRVDGSDSSVEPVVETSAVLPHGVREAAPRRSLVQSNAVTIAIEPSSK